MTNVIYADILIVVNIYVTYFLLRLTAAIIHTKVNIPRIVLSSIFGGFYSLIILVPEISNSIIAISRIFAAIILVFIAYKIENKKHLLRLILAFFTVNFIFAGAMIIIYLTFNNSILFNSGILYFNIDTISLLILTIVCYIIFICISKIIKSKVPTNLLYDMKIYISGKTYSCRGFVDTGSLISDPFSSLPVIIVNSSVFEDNFDLQSPNLKLRYIPCSSVTSQSVLPAFRVDKIYLKGINLEFETDQVLIALTDVKIKNGEFQALLNTKIFENKTNERGADYENNKRTYFTNKT